MSTDNSRGRRIATAACIWFFFAGELFVPLLGIQNDEALFASPIREPKSWEYALTIGKSHVALMLMSYLGTLKTLLYKPLLRWFGPGVWTVRQPMLLAGAATVWLFYLLLRRIAGERAAVMGACLLACDTMYLLTSVYDWGPVALQHLLMAGGMLLAVRFYQLKSDRALAGGYFLFGLAMWDKALASWILWAMSVAVALLFWRELRRELNLRRVGIAVAAYALGALPLLVYNIANPGATFSGNVKLDISELANKNEILLQTVKGQALLGLIVDEARPISVPHAPSGFFQNASSALAEQTGHPLNNLTLYALLLALVLTPLARGSDLRVVVFAWISMALAWAQMALTAHAGGSVHHAILMWPLPYMAIAVSLTAASRRIGRFGLPVLAAVTALLAVSSVLVTNEYYYRMVKQGGPPAWSDGVWMLSDFLRGTPAQFVFCVDWGLLDNLRLIGDGKIPLRDGTEQTAGPRLSEKNRAALQGMVAIPGAVFVGHSKDAEIFPGNTARLIEAASEAGWHPQRLITIADSFGRPAFEVYQFVR